MLGFLSTVRTDLLACLTIATLSVGLSTAAQAQTVFKVTAIPDESPTELARKAVPLIKYLEKV